MSDAAHNEVFKTVLWYSIFIILAPITAFFISKHLFESFGLIGTSPNVWSAINAVIVLHVALGMYIFRAYFDSTRVKETTKDD